MGLSVLGVATGMAAPAQAQLQLAPRPQPPLSLLDSLQPYPKAETRVTFSQVNDSMPAFLEPIVPAKDRVPGMKRADDDGWTAEVRSEMKRRKPLSHRHFHDMCPPVPNTDLAPGGL